MKKFKQGRFKVLLYAAAILLFGVGVLLTSVTVAQGAEENRVVAEQSDNTGLGLALAAPTKTVIPESTAAQPVKTETVIETPVPTETAESTPGPEFITEADAKESYTWVATELFGMNVDNSKLTAEFNGSTEYNSHEWWIVTSPDAHASIDAMSGDVLLFGVNDNKKYNGRKITLREYETDPAYSSEVYDDPNNAYNKAAAEIVGAKLANGRAIEEIMVGATQFAWTNGKGGSEPDAKGTIQVDVYVLMESGRCYVLSFLGTKEIELNIFNSFPTKDACLGGYYYEEEAGM